MCVLVLTNPLCIMVEEIKYVVRLYIVTDIVIVVATVVALTLRRFDITSNRKVLFLGSK